MGTGSALWGKEYTCESLSVWGFPPSLQDVSCKFICFLLSCRSDQYARMWWIKFLFSRNVTAQSHLDLKVWSCHTLRNELLGTASVNLSNVLKNNGGKSTYDEGVADVIHLWGWGEEFEGLDFSHTPQIDLVMQFPPGPGSAVTVPCGSRCGVLGRRELLSASTEGFSLLCPRALLVGCSDVSPWSFLEVECSPSAPLFPIWETCDMLNQTASSLNHCSPSLSPWAEQRSCVYLCVRVCEWGGVVLQIVPCA